MTPEIAWTVEARVLAGGRLRRTRIQQGLSIRSIAILAKISKTSVIQVESGRSSRQRTYLKVAEALGLHLARLVSAGTSSDHPYAVHRRANDAWFDLADFGSGRLSDLAQADPGTRGKLAIHDGVSPLNILASRLESGRVKPTILEVYTQSAYRAHSGEEFVFVLSGSAVITIGSEKVELGAGESVTFWSSESHSYAALAGSELPVRLLSVRVDT